VVRIRPEGPYGSVRATVLATLGKARLRVQVDIGIGDVAIPAPEWLDYPALLDFPRPRLRAYRPETTIAEKLHAMVVLGEANSRMRDFFDVFALAERRPFDGRLLVEALRATFARRGTRIPEKMPFALTPAFGALPTKQAQWRAFVRKSGLASAPPDFETVHDRVAAFLSPTLGAAPSAGAFSDTWPAGGPWTKAV
jgi:hypothetical protein